MAAVARLTTKVLRNTRTFLAHAPRNIAFNSLSIEVGDKIVTVRGFLGVRDAEDESPLEGAMCWGTGRELRSIVFSLKVEDNKVKFALPQVPKTWTNAEAEKYVKALILSQREKAQERFLDHVEKRRKSGGQYTGPRLEAHARDKTLPANKFASAMDKFTTMFVTLAPKLNITYR